MACASGNSIEPLEETRSGAAILEDLRPFECHESAFHHVVEMRQKGIDLILGIADLDDDGALVGRREWP
jgi:hypothetical protein